MGTNCLGLEIDLVQKVRFFRPQNRILMCIPPYLTRHNEIFQSLGYLKTWNRDLRRPLLPPGSSPSVPSTTSSP